VAARGLPAGSRAKGRLTRLSTVDFSGWARPASAARLGGVRPPQDPLTSWFGRVQVALPGEGWPTTDGAPMLALAQLNLRELPCPPPPALADVALLTLFLGPWQLPVDQPNGVNWTLRAYPTLDGLVELPEPTPARAGDPKLRKGQDLTLRPFPIRWQQHLDFPRRDDIPPGLLAAWDAWATDRDPTELTLTAPRSAAGRTASKARCAGIPAAGWSRTASTCCSSAARTRPGCRGGMPVWAMSLASRAPAPMAGTSPGNPYSRIPIP
jgi:hypothetical protein